MKRLLIFSKRIIKYAEIHKYLLCNGFIKKKCDYGRRYVTYDSHYSIYIWKSGLQMHSIYLYDEKQVFSPGLVNSFKLDKYKDIEKCKELTRYFRKSKISSMC